MFMRLQTQWVIAGMGSAVGLNYPSIEFLFTIYNVTKKSELFEKIRIIESGALSAMYEQSEKEK